MSPVCLCYVGDPDRALETGETLEGYTDESLQVLAVSPDRVESVLDNDRLGAVLCGTALGVETIQQVLAAADQADGSVPVFNLTTEVVSVPESVEYHHLPPGMGPDAAADWILSTAADGDVETTTDPTRPVFEGMDGYFAVDARRTVIEWGPDLVEMTGVTPEDARGSDIATVFEPATETPFNAACDRVTETGNPQTVEFRAASGDWFRVRVTADGLGGHRCFVRDISTRKGTETDIQATNGRFEDTIERITDAFFVLDNDEKITLLNSQAEFLLDVDAEDVVEKRFWDVFPAAISTTFYDEFNRAMDDQEPTSFEEHYKPLDSWFEVNAYPSEDGLSVFMRDVTDQVELQHKLELLHETTQQLIVDESDTAIAEDAVAAAVDVLDFPLVACWRYDETRRRLEPLAASEAVTDRVDEVQPVEPGAGLAWNVYDTGEYRVVDSVRVITPKSHYPGDVDSALLVPLGEYGLFGAYSEETAAFDETDTELFQILATAVESAMARARRERQLAKRNERLDDFASTVSHDLRNPLHVAAARTELARETGDLDHLETVTESIERMETLIQDLLDRARGKQDIERSQLSLANAARDAWQGLDTKDATLSVRDDAAFSADPTRLTQLFENLYRNAIDHVGPDVTVRVGVHEEGFYVADDGPGIPPEDRESVFDQGVTDSADGTGYGLAIVDDIVQGHDWSIEVVESETGGARFEVSHVTSLAERQSA